MDPQPVPPTTQELDVLEYVGSHDGCTFQDIKASTRYSSMGLHFCLADLTARGLLVIRKPAKATDNKQRYYMPQKGSTCQPSTSQ